MTRHFRAFNFRADITAQTFQRTIFSRKNLQRTTLSRDYINALTHYRARYFRVCRVSEKSLELEKFEYFSYSIIKWTIFFWRQRVDRSFYSAHKRSCKNIKPGNNFRTSVHLLICIHTHVHTYVLISSITVKQEKKWANG